MRDVSGRGNHVMPIIANKQAKVKPSQPDCRPLITRDTIKILLPSCSFRCSAKLLVRPFKPLSRAHQQRRAPDPCSQWRRISRGYRKIHITTQFSSRDLSNTQTIVSLSSQKCAEHCISERRRKVNEITMKFPYNGICGA